MASMSWPRAHRESRPPKPPPNQWRTPSTSTTSARSNCGTFRTPISIPFTCASFAERSWSIRTNARSAFAKRNSPTTASSSMAKSSSSAASTVIRRFPSSARPCPAAPSAAMPASCAINSIATSCALRIIRNPVISSMPATKWACLSSKRFPAGSTLATNPGSCSPSITSAA